MKSEATATIGSGEAKNNFSSMIAEVQKGKAYTITLRGKPVAKIIPIREQKADREEITRELYSLPCRGTIGSVDELLETIREGRK
jgi:prevent-host-death family protein